MARTHYIGLLIIALLAIASVHASDTLNAVSPADKATIDPRTDDFSISTLSDAIIANCKLYIDDQVVKTVPYNDQIRGRTLHYTVPIDDGEHTWYAACSGTDVELTSPKRTFTAKNPEDTGVTVTSSGVFRGSFDHTFSFQNTESQKPIVVQKLAPGDFLVINLKVPPSNIQKSLYVKQQSSKNGKLFLWLEDTKLNENYYLYQGENVTVNITTSRIVLQYRGIEYNKATVVAYSPLSKVSADKPPATERPGDETAPGLSEQQENTTAPDNTTAPVVNPTPETAPTTPTTETPPTVQPTQDTTPPVEPAAKQGFFKRVLAWFSGLFG